MSLTYPQTSCVHTTFDASSFLAKKRKIVFENTLLYQLQVLKDTGRYDAFKLKWHSSYGDAPDHWPVPNHLFWDSDVAKWIEGACYFLQEKENQNKEIEAAVHELVDMIRSAQQPDGYLNIHFTVVAPNDRFSNLRDLHELYNAGHLIEAALAHENLYKNRLLLDPLIKYVDLFVQTFGPGENQKHGYPGHPEVELSLLRLYEHTGDPNHRKLAEYFIQERGNTKGVQGRHYYDVEAEARGEGDRVVPGYYPQPRSYWYQQAHVPILQQQTIEGHSVRAMYLLTAVADMVRLVDGEPSAQYHEACTRLWDNMVDKKMYLTGGIGSIKQWEGFGIDYSLPQGTDEGGCYAETCASIGTIMLADRMLRLDRDMKFADIMELCFYNAVLTGMSCDGNQFTYDNQLASSSSSLSKRSEWFTCACCPPNVTRLLGSFGGYLWQTSIDEQKKAAEVTVNMYASATLNFIVDEKEVIVQQKSNWPWAGEIDISVQSPDDVDVSLALRIPSWASEWTISPAIENLNVSKGYLLLPSDIVRKNPHIRLSLPMSVRQLSPHPFTNQDVVALARGPLIYCVEDVDNSWVDDHFKTVLYDRSAKVTEHQMTDSHTGETYTGLTAHSAAYSLNAQSVQSPAGVGTIVEGNAKDLHFVPYYFRANRGGEGQMRVGLRVKRT